MIKLKLSPKKEATHVYVLIVPLGGKYARKIREEKANVTKLSLVMLVYIFVTLKSLIV